MTVNGIAYETAGAGQPVVLLHGGLLDRRQWDTEFAALSETHHVVRFDARGHGTSAGPDGDYAVHDDLIAVLDHLDLPRVTAVGLSLGARTVIDAALLYPHRFGALLLVSPGYSGIEFTDPFVVAQHEAMARAAGDRDLDAFVEAFLRAWIDGPHRTPAQVDPAVRARCHEMAASAAAIRAGGSGTLIEVGAADRLGELSMPVDVVLGELDSADIHAAGERIATAAPDARVHRIAGAAHAVNLDQPDAFGAVLRQFLSSRSPGPQYPGAR
jgi:pimeloyl-ACP methyl ester carboxylesterase